MNGADIIFANSVVFDGTKKSPITIEGDRTGGIAIFNIDQSSSIVHTNFSKLAYVDAPGYHYTGAINLYSGKLNLENVTINENKSEDQLNVIYALVDIDNLSINGSQSDALDCDFCVGSISNFTFSSVKGDGLDVSGSHLTVKKTSGSNVKDKAISIGEQSAVKVFGTKLNNVSTAIAVKDGSTAFVKDIELFGLIDDAFMTYVKKPFFKANKFES